MKALRFYGEPPPGIGEARFAGRLIVVEGTDGVGRSTQIALLKEWLEDRGFAVLDTGLTRSELAGPGIKRAKEGNTLDAITLNLFYATDFWDRLEREILPALRAGMIAIADRYIYSLIARAVVRGVPSDWITALYGFAPIPDLVMYLDVDVEQLLPRVLTSTGFDYWESGQDFLPGSDVYETFVEYQRSLLAEFRALSRTHEIATVNARGSVPEIFEEVRKHVEQVVDEMASEVPITPNGASSASPAT